MEFYFSDSNLPTDNFMRKTVSESEDGSIPFFFFGFPPISIIVVVIIWFGAFAEIIFKFSIVDLDRECTVVSLGLICSFNRMRKHLNLGDVKSDEVSQDTVAAVAQALRSSASLKVSEDG